MRDRVGCAQHVQPHRTRRQLLPETIDPYLQEYTPESGRVRQLGRAQITEMPKNTLLLGDGQSPPAVGARFLSRAAEWRRRDDTGTGDALGRQIAQVSRQRRAPAPAADLCARNRNAISVR